MKMAQKYVIGKQLGFILMNEEMKDEHEPFACFYSKDCLLLKNLKNEILVVIWSLSLKTFGFFTIKLFTCKWKLWSWYFICQFLFSQYIRILEDTNKYSAKTFKCSLCDKKFRLFHWNSFFLGILALLESGNFQNSGKGRVKAPGGR